MNPEDTVPSRPGPGGTPSVVQTHLWVGGWLSPLLVAGFTIFWSLLIYGLIGDRPRDWQYGVAPYVPGQSVASVEPTPSGPPPRQVELPDSETGGPGAKP